MSDPSWAKHIADVLRRDDLRLFATVPDYPFEPDIIGQTSRFRRKFAAL